MHVVSRVAVYSVSYDDIMVRICLEDVSASKN